MVHGTDLGLQEIRAQRKPQAHLRLHLGIGDPFLPMGQRDICALATDLCAKKLAVEILWFPLRAALQVPRFLVSSYVIFGGDATMTATQSPQRLGLRLIFLVFLLLVPDVRSAPATKPSLRQQQTPHCLHRGDIPITNIPNAADCNNLARTFRTASGSDEARVWGLKAKEWPIAVVPLPAKMSNGTCEIHINVDGSPYYDIAKYNDFADVIQNTVKFCLSNPFGVAIGGAAQVGANGWLMVSVTGKMALEGNDATAMESGVTTARDGLEEASIGISSLSSTINGTAVVIPDTVKQPELT